ncbi:MAG: DUF1232 domain-containing protein [Gammaproteobacteria bacterium]|nr:DUF1232 domain-containing protein [Gammaproteobacteria bacterium]
MAEQIENLQHPAFGAARKRAGRILRDAQRRNDFLDSAAQKAGRLRGQFAKRLEDLGTLIRLVRAAGSGRYRQLPWRSLVLASAAILYFVNPLDLVPDWLHMVGFLDDATVIGLVVSALAEELARFRAWEDPRSENNTAEVSM